MGNYIPDLSRPRNEPVFWLGVLASLLLVGLQILTDAGIDTTVVAGLIPVLTSLAARARVAGPETYAATLEADV